MAGTLRAPRRRDRPPPLVWTCPNHRTPGHASARPRAGPARPGGRGAARCQPRRSARARKRPSGSARWPPGLPERGGMRRGARRPASRPPGLLPIRAGEERSFCAAFWFSARTAPFRWMPLGCRLRAAQVPLVRRSACVFVAVFFGLRCGVGTIAQHSRAVRARASRARRSPRSASRCAAAPCGRGSACAPLRAVASSLRPPWPWRPVAVPLAPLRSAVRSARRSAPLRRCRCRARGADRSRLRSAPLALRSRLRSAPSLRPPWPSTPRPAAPLIARRARAAPALGASPLGAGALPACPARGPGRPRALLAEPPGGARPPSVLRRAPGARRRARSAPVRPARPPAALRGRPARRPAGDGQPPALRLRAPPGGRPLRPALCHRPGWPPRRGGGGAGARVHPPGGPPRWAASGGALRRLPVAGAPSRLSGLCNNGAVYAAAHCGG